MSRRAFMVNSGGIGLLIGGIVSACGGFPGFDEAGSPGPMTTTSTTTTPSQPLVADLPIDTSPVTLAAAGAYPVIDVGAGESVPDLPPGRYRLRFEFQADWPEECLSETEIADLPDPQIGDTIELPPDVAASPEFLQNQVRVFEELQRLLEPICGPFWDEYNLSHPLPTASDDGPSAGEPSPTTTESQ